MERHALPAADQNILRARPPGSHQQHNILRCRLLFLERPSSFEPQPVSKIILDPLLTISILVFFPLWRKGWAQCLPSGNLSNGTCAPLILVSQLPVFFVLRIVLSFFRQHDSIRIDNKLLPHLWHLVVGREGVQRRPKDKPAVAGLCMGEQTGSRALQHLWSYVAEAVTTKAYVR